MNGKIDALSNDRTDRQLTMMDMWQTQMEKNQQKMQKVSETPQSSEAEIRRKLKNGEIECETCKNRQYVDGSDDMGVSFKTPTKVSAAQSKSAVLSHENEHVQRNRAEALEEGKEVTHSSVTLQYATCPDCGRSYVAGGLTHTITSGKSENSPSAMQDKLYKGLLNTKI